MSEHECKIAVGEARLWRDPHLWRDVGSPTSKSNENASWFRVSNMPEGSEADLFWVTGNEWAFLFRSKEMNYMSKEVYPSKESALEGLKIWLERNLRELRPQSVRGHGA